MIKIRTKKRSNDEKNKYGIKFKKKKIPIKIRTAVLVIFGLLVISSLYSAYAITGEEAKSMEKSITTVSYVQNANFNYVAHLRDNTVYNFTTILPGQAIIFKKITDYFNMSFSYKFNCAQSTNISGSYALVTEIQTEDNLWSRAYTLIPKTTFKEDTFDLNFDLNLTNYETTVAAINNEIGITASNPTLVIRCEITLSSQTPEGLIFDYFEPSISIPLTGNIIDINDLLSQRKTGELTEKVTVNIPEEDVSEERNGPLLLAAVFFLPIIPVALFTENDTTRLSSIQKQVNKIMKKYGEWIVKVNHLPKRPIGTEIVYMNSMDDLIKISEELGKPVISFKTKSSGAYAFVVLDENIHYAFILGDN